MCKKMACLSLLILFLAATLPALAEGPRREIRERGFVPPDEVATYQFVIQKTYERLSSYIRPSGKVVSFELSDFDTLAPAQFKYVYWLDAVTMPDGQMLSVTRSVRQNDYTQTAGVYYQPVWQTGHGEWAATEDGRRLQSLKIADVLRETGAKQPEKARAVALTSFNVTVSMDSQSRTYRAAFLWLPAAGSSERTFVVLDNITQGVEEAAREFLPARSLAEDLATIAEGHGLQPKAVCTASSSPTQVSYHSQGTAGHFSGQHSGDATFKITCSCTSTCASTCVAEIPSASCVDSGGFTADACHKMASSMNANTNRNDNGNVTAAACAAGYGCVQKSCLFCLCGLSVTVSVSGASVNFATSGDPGWQGNLQYSRTCGLCH